MKATTIKAQAEEAKSVLVAGVKLGVILGLICLGVVLGIPDLTLNESAGLASLVAAVGFGIKFLR